jgi:hypothetical protein
MECSEHDDAISMVIGAYRMMILQMEKLILNSPFV